jgi:hypothetical protein
MGHFYKKEGEIWFEAKRVNLPDFTTLDCTDGEPEIKEKDGWVYLKERPDDFVEYGDEN